MNSLRFFWRELSFSKGLISVFVLCMALSLISVVSLGSFDASVQDSLREDAQEISGGDVIINSRRPYSEQLEQALNEQAPRGTEDRTDWLRFTSVVASPINEQSALAQVQVVDDQYPLYGQVQVADGEYEERFGPGKILLEQNLIERLELESGDVIAVGESRFEVGGILKSLPTGSFSLFSSGQTLLMHSEDVESTGLLGARSRVGFQTALRIPDEEQISELVSRLEQAKGDREQVERYDDFETSTQRFLEEFLFFLNIISIFTLLLSGLGIMSSLSAYVRKRQQTTAVLKTLGMTSDQISWMFMRFVLVLAVVGMLIGAAGGVFLLRTLPAYFAEFLPESFSAELQWLPFLQVLLMGFVLSFLFTLVPLLRLRNVKPVEVFRKEVRSERSQRRWNALLVLVILALFSAFIFLEVGSLFLGSWIIAALVGLISLMYICSKLSLLMLRWLSNRRGFLLGRLSIKALLRPGGKMDLIMTCIATAFAVLMSISLLESNILQQFVNTYPEGFPNVFLLDIQRDQRDKIQQDLPEIVDFYPVIRANLVAKNGETISTSPEDLPRTGDNVRRSFNLTYGTPLSNNERIVESRVPGELFDRSLVDTERQQVSILQDFQSVLPTEVGDVLRFSIQGIEIEAEVSSVRKRQENRFEPFFYFVFEGDALQDAPQTLFATVFLADEEIPALQNQVAKDYPNVATINTNEIISRTADLLEKLTNIIRFFTVFSLIAGLVLLISALLSTSLERIKEVVYYKLLGFRTPQVASIALLEFAFLGFFAAVLGTLVSQIAVYLVTVQLLDIDFYSFPWLMLRANLILFGVVMLLAAVFLVPLLRTRPLEYLRDNLVE